jgi:hypothetical protein
MIVLVPLNLAILLLDAKHPLFLVMIMMLVPMMIVTLDPDVPTPQLNVMTTMHVPMIPAIQTLDANINPTNANTKMLAIL